MRKVQKNFIILFCAILFAIFLILAAIFQDKLIYIVTQTWNGMEIRIEESKRQINQENVLETEDSYIIQDESRESHIEGEQLEISSQVESSSVTEYDSNIQVFPNFEEESDEVSEVSSVSPQESETDTESSLVIEESSLVIEESRETIDKSKLTEFPITPY